MKQHTDKEDNDFFPAFNRLIPATSQQNKRIKSPEHAVPAAVTVVDDYNYFSERENGPSRSQYSQPATTPHRDIADNRQHRIQAPQTRTQYFSEMDEVEVEEDDLLYGYPTAPSQRRHPKSRVIDEEYIDDVREEPYERPKTRRRVSQAPTYTAAAPPAQFDLRQQLEQLQRKYDELVNLRYTQAEENILRLKETANRQLQEADNRVQHLQRSLDDKENKLQEMESVLQEKERVYHEREKEIRDFKNDVTLQQQRIQQAWDTEKEQSTKEIDILKAKVERLESERNDQGMSKYVNDDQRIKHLVETYEDLTGLLVTDIKDTNNGQVYNCVQSGSNGTIQFKLYRQDGPTREFTYQPIFDTERDGAMVKKLPGQMLSDVNFRQEQACLFHCKLSYALLHQSKK
ncbi:chromosome segregation protein Csm1/Pcs1-domain-containing protein [Zychaea mexicana]|uniref:chromosome segregation protein Csm1/Pcs1-domain-containing protein n=1 Tax=Zychaea mexicana TaxID=64656 RepID=UPI0022FF0E6E|nr:chromosome segregation protein Csm1/Pcs1-domain-containing protein [Zychaea mexicana]KAI9497645.1 chromosome segregation protein Csm1/Pcs1-domain-containing protein [Zychaea mexicana]